MKRWWKLFWINGTRLGWGQPSQIYPIIIFKSYNLFNLKFLKCNSTIFYFVYDQKSTNKTSKYGNQCEKNIYILIKLCILYFVLFFYFFIFVWKLIFYFNNLYFLFNFWWKLIYNGKIQEDNMMCFHHKLAFDG